MCAAPASPDSADETPPDWNYEAIVEEIEAIVAQIEAGDLELDAVFEQFARATRYLNQCEQFLATRQQQMELLIENLTDDSEQ